MLKYFIILLQKSLIEILYKRYEAWFAGAKQCLIDHVFYCRKCYLNYSMNLTILESK